MVITFPDQAAVTPVGKPVAVPMPVAPVVAWVIFDIAALTHKVGVLDAAYAVFTLTVIAPVAFTVPQPPVNGIV